VPVPGLFGGTQVSTSGNHTLAVAGSSGQVWAWGVNRNCELGDGMTIEQHSPEPIGLAGITQVDAQADPFGDSSAVRSDGTLLTSGVNESGELGYDTSGANQLVPRAVPSLTGVTRAQIIDNNAVVIGQPPPPPPMVRCRT
jgi:alpha-tubulin suppressor-like RCC1 family protein